MSLRERAEDFLQTLAAVRYRRRMGNDADLGIPEVYARFADLWQRDAITETQRALAGATGEEEQAARFFLEFLVDARIGGAAAAELEQRFAWAHNGVVTAGEHRIRFANVPAALAAIARPAERWALEDARNSALEDIELVLERVAEREDDVLGDLGYGDPVRARGVISGTDLLGLAREGARFLAETDPLYRELLAWHLPRLADVSPGEARSEDAARLTRAEPFDDLFPAGALLPAVRGMLREIGLDAITGGRIAVEEVAAEAHVTAAHALRIPEHVLLVVADGRGRVAWDATLRELGLALGFGYTAAGLPTEFRWLGDRSVSLAYGLTFGRLLTHPVWLERVHGLRRERRDAYLRLALLLELLELRTQIGRLQFELELHDGSGFEGKPGRYAEILTAATGLRHDPRSYLWDTEPSFAAARKVRAAQLHATLAEHLRDRFDEDWFRNPQTGAALQDLFGQGRRFTATEMAMQLTSRPLSFESVLNRIGELSQ